MLTSARPFALLALIVGGLVLALTTGPTLADGSVRSGGPAATGTLVAGASGPGAFAVVHERPGLSLSRPVTSPRPSATAASRQRLRVMTWNIHQGYTHPGLPGIAAEIRRVDADVVGLNEALDGQAKYLAAHAGYRYYRTYPLFKKSNGRWLGNAVLSKQPIVETQRIPLPHATSHCSVGYACEPRGVLRVKIDLHGTRVWYSLTHLNPGAYRIVQGEKAARVANAANCPSMLLGDMNTTPGQRPYTALHRHLLDVYARTNPGDPGYTAPAGGPNHRIDYIFARALTEPDHSYVDRRRASDHRAVVAIFLLPDDRSC